MHNERIHEHLCLHMYMRSTILSSEETKCSRESQLRSQTLVLNTQVQIVVLLLTPYVILDKFLSLAMPLFSYLQNKGDCRTYLIWFVNTLQVDVCTRKNTWIVDNTTQCLQILWKDFKAVHCFDILQMRLTCTLEFIESFEPYLFPYVPFHSFPLTFRFPTLQNNWSEPSTCTYALLHCLKFSFFMNTLFPSFFK